MDCLVSSDLLARGLVLLSDIVSDTTVGGGQSGRIELAAVIEVSDKGARTDGTGAQVSATVADVLARVPMRCPTPLGVGHPVSVRRPCRTSAMH